MKVVCITWIESPDGEPVRIVESPDGEPVRIVESPDGEPVRISALFPLIRRFLRTAKKGEVMILRIDEMTRKAFKGLRED